MVHFICDVAQDKLEILILKKIILATPGGRISVRPILFCGLVCLKIEIGLV